MASTILNENAVIMPAGTSAQRPWPDGTTSGDLDGAIRKNTQTGLVEYWDAANNLWLGIGAYNATGGTQSSSGDDLIHTFTSSGTYSVTSGTKQIDVLIVAGGGSGGGHACGGGGGGGGLIYKTGLGTSEGAYGITVGAGGPRTNTQGPGGYQTGIRGGNSSAFGMTAIGGGGGVCWDGSNPLANNINGGSTGGYGNGGSVNSGTPTAQQPLQPGDSGLYGFGTRGGEAVYYGNPYPGGGGGGAGQAGQSSPNSSTAGKGGDGKTYSISGTSRTYAGGGGGGGWSTSGGRAGGAGGGGDGDCSGPNGTGNSARGFIGYAEGQAGVANTGGGGGATGRTGGETAYGGAGGSGIVIIRYTA
jgi:hypothetical protein